MTTKNKPQPTNDEINHIRQEAMEFAGIGLCRFDFDSTIMFIDKGALKIFDLEEKYPDPFITVGKKLTELITFITPLEDIITKVRKHRQIRDVEQKFKTVSGNTKWIVHFSYLVKDSETGKDTIQTIFRDITKRKRTEENLHESEKKHRDLNRLMRLICNNVPDLIWAKDMDDRFLLVNQVTCEKLLLCTNPDEAVGKKNKYFTEREHAAGYECTFSEKCAHSDAVTLERKAQGRFLEDGLIRGKLLVLDVHKAPILNENNEIIGIVGSGRDITEEIKTKEALQKSEIRFRAIFDEARIGIVIFDDEGHPVVANPVFQRMIGYNEQELKAMTFTQYTHYTDINRSLEQYNSLLNGEIDHYLLEKRYVRKDGELIWGRLNVSHFPESVGMQDRVLAMIEDITRQKNLENKLLQIHKVESLKTMAGGIAHDFNNLLQTILGNANLALMDISPYSPVRESLQHIEKSAQRASKLTMQMLAYTGKSRFNLQLIDISDLVQRIEHFIRTAITKKVSLKLSLQSDLPPIEADTSQIRQIVMSLVTNAYEAIGDKDGVITIATGIKKCDRSCLDQTYISYDLEKGNYVYLDVSDTGCGMDEVMLANIFDPFYSTKFTGRGLGLAATLGIIHAHKGTIRVESEPGKGALFRVFFPASKKTLPKESLLKTQTEQWQGSGTILLVEDQAEVREVTKRMLELIGFDVITASDGLEAVQVFRKHLDVRLIFLDLTMPHMNGEETLKEIRRIKSDALVLLSSGYGELDVVQQFAGKGLAGFIQKPYRLEIIIDKIRKILGN